MGKSRFYATRRVSGRPDRLGHGFARLQCGLDPPRGPGCAARATLLARLVLHVFLVFLVLLVLLVPSIADTHAH